MLEQKNTRQERAFRHAAYVTLQTVRTRRWRLRNLLGRATVYRIPRYMLLGEY
jgi:hypothetical protein